MPSDHWIGDLETFIALAMRGVEICKTDICLTLGITPIAPATGFGFIEVDAGATSLSDVRSFNQKPDLANVEACRALGGRF